MRKFQKAALAATSAVAIALAGTSVAAAQDGVEGQTLDSNNSSTPYFSDETGYDYFESLNKISSENSSEKSTGLSSDAARATGAYNGDNSKVEGRDIFGERVAGDETGKAEWAKVWRDTTLVGVIATLVGGAIAFVNYLSFTGQIQLPKF